MAFRKPRSWGRTQPHAGARIDFGHPITRGLKAAWPHNSIVGSPASGGATLYPASGIGPLFRSVAPRVQTAIGKALSYNGTTTVTTLQDAAALQFERTQPFSVSVWALSTASGAAASGALAGTLDVTGTTYRGWELAGTSFGDATSNFQFALINTVTTKWIIAQTAAGTLPANKLLHLVATYDGTGVAAGVKLYINGVDMAVTVVGDNLGANTTVSGIAVLMGQRNNASAPHTGPITNLAVWTRKLSAQEVKLLYAEPYVYLLHTRVNLPHSAGSSPATAMQLSGSGSSLYLTPSADITVTANGDITGTVTYTPGTDAGTQTFNPTSVNISSGTPSATFKITGTSIGARNITGTNNGGLSNPTYAHTVNADVPNAPTNVTVVDNHDGTITVSYTQSSNNGGAAITGNSLLTSAAQTANASLPGVPISITPANLVPIMVQVRSTNSAGNSNYSTASASITPDNHTIPETVGIWIRAPYLTTDSIPVLASLTLTVYDAYGAVDATATYDFNAIPHITNGYWVLVSVVPNGAFGDFAGVAVFHDINVTQKAAVELYSPPTEVPTEFVVCKVAPFLFGDTIVTARYQLYDIAGAAYGSPVTGATIWTIPGVTNGRAARIQLPVGTDNGAQYGILWDLG